MRYLWAVIVAVAVSALVPGSSAGAGGSPVDAQAGLDRAGSDPVAGEQFRVVASVAGVGGESAPFSFTLTVTVPDGLELVRVSKEFSAASCTISGRTVACQDAVIGGVAASQSFRLDLRAARPGSYTIRSAVRVEDGSDNNPADNVAELAVTVREAPVSVAGVTNTPARPRAGKPFAATLTVTRAGAPLRADSVACKASVGTTKVAGRGESVAAGGRCTWRIPASARGKRFAGSVTLTAGGARITRPVAAVVG